MVLFKPETVLSGIRSAFRKNGEVSPGNLASFRLKKKVTCEINPLSSAFGYTRTITALISQDYFLSFTLRFIIFPNVYNFFRDNFSGAK